MREKILPNVRVLAAALFSVAFIIGAYVFARGIESPSVAQASPETALLQAIAAKDSNGDGLPDWEKALYGIPVNATTTDYFHLGMTDGEAVAKGLIVPKAIANVSIAVSSSTSLDSNGLPPPPAAGTLTAAFAKNFLTFFLAAKQANGGADLSQQDMQNVANETIHSLSSIAVVTPDYKSASDLTVSGSGTDALKTFAASVEAVFLKNTSNATTSEVNYLQYAVDGNDAAALTHIASIAKAYRDTAVGLAVLPVPQELAAYDLTLINTMMRISEITSDFARVHNDPLATIIALEQYPQAVQSLGIAFMNIGEIYVSAGISLPAGVPGASFVNFIDGVAASRQTVASKP